MPWPWFPHGLSEKTKQKQNNNSLFHTFIYDPMTVN